MTHGHRIGLARCRRSPAPAGGPKNNLSCRQSEGGRTPRAWPHPCRLVPRQPKIVTLSPGLIVTSFFHPVR